MTTPHGWMSTTALAVAWALSACATPDNRPRLHDDVRQEIKRIESENHAAPVLKTVRESYVRAEQVEYAEPRDAVTLQLGNGSMLAAIGAIARQRGYAVVMTKGITNDKLNLDVVGLDFKRAVREIAATAGYVAVFDEQRKGIYIGPEAMYTYRIPQQMFESPNMDYNVSSNPGESVSSGQPGMGSAGTQGGAAAPVGGGIPNAAGRPNMRVVGKTGNALASFLQALREIAGPNAQVSLMPEAGLLSVRGDGMALKRATSFLEAFCVDANRQVQLKVALIDVTLTDEMAYGIDWKRFLNRSFGQTTIDLQTANIVQNPALTTTVTSSSVTSVINALQGTTTVKIVAEPELRLLNHQHGILLNAKQRPVLESVQTTISGTSALATTSGALSYVQDGVSLAFKPNIFDDNRAELTVIPFLSTAVNKQVFQPGNGLQLTGFDLPTSSSHMKVLLESGKTYVIGGNRLTQQNAQKNGVPGLRDAPGLGQLLSGTDDTKSGRELVLLLHVDIVPAPDMSIIIGESL